MLHLNVCDLIFKLKLSLHREWYSLLGDLCFLPKIVQHITKHLNLDTMYCILLCIMHTFLPKFFREK